MSNQAVQPQVSSTAAEPDSRITQTTPAVEPTGAVIGVFQTRLQAEQSIRSLESSGIPLKRLSIIGKDYHIEEQPIGFYSLGDRVKSWGSVGLFWGGLWGLLFGAAFIWIPGIGPVAAAGPFVHLLVSAVEGAVVVGGGQNLVAVGNEAMGAGTVSGDNNVAVGKNSIKGEFGGYQ